MNKRNVGGLQVCPIGLGCMGMSEFYGPADEAASLGAIDRALELGISMFDTADMYGPFKNEELLARAMRGRREKFVIATKFGIVRDPADPSKRGINGKSDYVRASCEGSLKRLGATVLDLYYQHRVDPSTPIEETVDAMAELVQAGKIRHIGLSEADMPWLCGTSQNVRQSSYSIWRRDEDEQVYGRANGQNSSRGGSLARQGGRAKTCNQRANALRVEA